MHPLIIIGAGLAGYSLAREFRRLDKDTPVLLISADDGRYYAKPSLSNALAQGKTADKLALSSAAQMADTLKSQVLPHTLVERIDPQAQQVFTQDGNYAYSALVLALGAEPIRPPLAGDGASAVLSINNLQDYAQFRARLDKAQHVALIGPGLIGCEFANDLVQAGKQVSVIGPDAYPVSSLLPPAVGTALQQALTQAGVNWHLGTVAQSVTHTGQGYTLTLNNGDTVTADLVLSAVGLRPSTTLAAAAGLTVQRGILTDAYLRSSVSNIYALGDCAAVAGRNLPYVAPLMLGAKALAKTLSGADTAVIYPVMPVQIKTPAYPVVVVPPPLGAVGTWQAETVPDGVQARFLADTGELLGFALGGGATTTHRQALLNAMGAV